jgi:hypothetical protein
MSQTLSSRSVLAACQAVLTTTGRHQGSTVTLRLPA